MPTAWCNHCSTTSHAFMLSGGVVSCHCETQSTMAVTSNEAEFPAAAIAFFLFAILKAPHCVCHSPLKRSPTAVFTNPFFCPAHNFC